MCLFLCLHQNSKFQLIKPEASAGSLVELLLLLDNSQKKFGFIEVVNGQPSRILDNERGGRYALAHVKKLQEYVTLEESTFPNGQVFSRTKQFLGDQNGGYLCSNW